MACTTAMELVKRSVPLWVGLLAISTGLPAQEPPPAARESLLAVNAARFTAMVHGDLRGLDTLLAPELTYIHTDGVLESKAEFLATLRTGRLQYRSIKPDSLRVRLYGEAGVITGRSRMQVKAGPELHRFDIRFTSVYRREGRKWILVAWQATRLAEP